MNRVPAAACAVAVALSVILGAVAGRYLPPRVEGPPSAAPLVAVGATYRTGLGTAYAAAWQAGARILDGGGDIEKAIATVGSTWATSRTSLYNRTIAPELEKIVPSGTADADVTAAQRQTMATAFRSIATGLTQ